MLCPRQGANCCYIDNVKLLHDLMKILLLFPRSFTVSTVFYCFHGLLLFPRSFTVPTVFYCFHGLLLFPRSFTVSTVFYCFHGLLLFPRSVNFSLIIFFSGNISHRSLFSPDSLFITGHYFYQPPLPLVTKFTNFLTCKPQVSMLAGAAQDDDELQMKEYQREYLDFFDDGKDQDIYISKVP